MVDEAHRTQEGDLGRKMRQALPNAFLFGLTGTPINRADRNTFWAFGADEDDKGYLSHDIEMLVLDADVLEEILADVEPGKRAREVEIKLIARLRKYLGHLNHSAENRMTLDLSDLASNCTQHALQSTAAPARCT